MISIRNLSKNYGPTLAVDDLSLEVPKGQILGLLGPNGAGKSTTLRILTGYLRPSGGTVLVDGLDVQAEPLKVKSRLGYLPESAPLYGEMLVYDYLEYIAEIRGIPRDSRLEEIRKTGELCGILSVMHKSINTLSKGYRQRVGLALAMLNDPEILILDEPTSGLDPNQIMEIRNIIREIGRKKTVIFSTHILSEAEATCDRVVIINQGKIAADGPADSLHSSLQAEQTISLTVKGAPEAALKDRMLALPGVLSCETGEKDGLLQGTLQCSSGGSGHSSHSSGSGTPGDIREEIYRSLKATDWIILEFVQEKKSLETVFQELTRSGGPAEHSQGNSKEAQEDTNG